MLMLYSDLVCCSTLHRSLSPVGLWHPGCQLALSCSYECLGSKMSEVTTPKRLHHYSQIRSTAFSHRINKVKSRTKSKSIFKPTAISGLATNLYSSLKNKKQILTFQLPSGSKIFDANVISKSFKQKAALLIHAYFSRSKQWFHPPTDRLREDLITSGLAYCICHPDNPDSVVITLS